MDVLKRKPHLHDKVEFDILFTCLDFSFDKKIKDLPDLDLSNKEIEILREHLFVLTDKIVSGKSKTFKELLKSIL